MKPKFTFIIGIIILGLICCHKENTNDFKSFGKITGPDMRMCPSPCCGGWNIQIDSLTYQFDSIPMNSNIDLPKDSFPIFVKLDWQLSNSSLCPGVGRIKILRIERVFLFD